MREALTKKYGPLPVWAWAIIGLVILYGGYRWYSNRSSSSVDGIAGQAPKSNLGTRSGAGGGGFSLPDLLPNTTVGESTQTPVVTAPSNTGGEANVQLASADITTVMPTDAALANPNSPEAIAASGDQPYTGYLAGGQTGYVIDSSGQVYGPSTSTEGGLRERVGQPGNFPDAVDRYLANQAVESVPFTLDAAPPSPTPITQKILPQPVDTLPANRATIGKATAV